MASVYKLWYAMMWQEFGHMLFHHLVASALENDWQMSLPSQNGSSCLPYTCMCYFSVHVAFKVLSKQSILCTFIIEKDKLGQYCFQFLMLLILIVIFFSLTVFLNHFSSQIDVKTCTLWRRKYNALIDQNILSSSFKVKVTIFQETFLELVCTI